LAGDLLGGEKLKLDVDLTWKGQLQTMLEFAAPPDTRNSPSLPEGHAEFQGHLSGEVDRLAETLRADGRLHAEGLKYQAWYAESLQLHLGWAARGKGLGDLQIHSAEIRSPEVERVGGRNAGGGGLVKLGAFRISIGGALPAVTVPLDLERAHVHWLAASELKSLYLLDARVSGRTELKFTPPTNPSSKDWKVQVEVDWAVSPLQLDNQRLGVSKPLSRTLLTSPFAVKGVFRINSEELLPLDVQILMKDTTLTLGGKVSFKNGYALLGQGKVNLSEFPMVAENKISGVGTLQVGVFGKPEAVKISFDADLDQASYLGLLFGRMRGRISWDDGPSELLAEGVEFEKGRSKVRLTGKIRSTGAADQALELDGVVREESDFGDFLSIFSNLTRDLDWLPREIRGATQGSLKLRGGLDLRSMQVEAQFRGKDWDYFGERFRSIELRGGYDSGRYFLDQVAIQKRSGNVLGKISYDQHSQHISWEGTTQNFRLTEWDRLLALDVPFRGRVEITTRGEGKLGATRSTTQLRLEEFTVRTQAYPISWLEVRTEGGRYQVDGQAQGGAGVLKIRMQPPGSSTKSRFELRLQELDFAPAVMLLNPTLMEDREFRTAITGSLELEFPGEQWDLGSGMFQAGKYLLQKTESQLELVAPVSIKIEQGSFQVPPTQFRSKTSSLILTGRSEKQILSGSIQGELDLSFLEFFTSTIEKGSGAMRMSFGVGGTLLSPKLAGTVRFPKVEARLSPRLKIRALDTPIENLLGEIRVQDGLLSVKALQGELATGRVQLLGAVQLFQNRWPRLDLEAELFGNRLKVYPFQYVKMRGRLQMRGEERPYQVTGQVQIDSGLSKEKISRASSQGPGLKSARYEPPPSQVRASDLPLFLMKIEAKAPGNVLIQNEIFDVEVRGDLQVLHTFQTPRVLGKAEVLQGKLTFKDRIFQIQSGTVEFDNPTVMDPRFELTAQTDLSGRKISLLAVGRLSSYRIEFTSNPPMPENEILSLLAIGNTQDDRRVRFSDRGAYEQSEAASLVLHSLDFNRELQQKTGFSLNIEEAQGEMEAASAFRPRTTGAEAATSPKVVIRRQLGKRVGVSVGSTIGVGTMRQQEVNAEFSVNQNMTVNGVWDAVEGIDTRNRNSFGVDLRLQKRFK
jgi:hypothetical protein